MALFQGQILCNRYRIEAVLGQGGFGAVYKAVDCNLNRRIAIKENLDSSAAAQRQFQLEAQVLTRLRHSNLPQIYDFFIEPNGQQYLVMEFVEGSDLFTRVQQQNGLPESQLLPWITQILDALEYLHTQNPPILHRDIKPHNIIIMPQGRAMLVDFGIAKIYVPGQMTTTGARGVTPGFSPPEQYGGGTDPRSDLYALGATIYFAVTGVPPPEAPMLMTGYTTLSSARQYARNLSAHTESVILRALQPQPAQRFQSASEMKMALATLACSPPGVAAPAPYITLPVRASPWMFVSIIGGIASVLLCLTLVAVLFVHPPAPITSPTLASAQVTSTAIPAAMLTQVPPTASIEISTRASVATVTPTRGPTATPAPTPFFAEEFDGAELDLSRWNASARGGRYVVSRSLLTMSSSGTSYPFITSRANPFPSSGSFRLSMRYRYGSLNTCGVGIMMTSYTLPAGLGQDEAAGVQRANEDNGMAAGMWQDNKDPLHLSFRSHSDRVDVQPLGFDTTWHTQVIEYANGRYTISLDGVAMYVSQATPHRASFIWLGNPVELGRGFDCPWDTLEVDYMRVETIR